jgi:hypothetical protein
MHEPPIHVVMMMMVVVMVMMMMMVMMVMMMVHTEMGFHQSIQQKLTSKERQASVSSSDFLPTLYNTKLCPSDGCQAVGESHPSMSECIVKL